METMFITDEIRGKFERCNIKIYSDHLYFGEHIAVEEFSDFKKEFLYTTGAFSYSYAVLPLDIRVGRYSSIAEGFGALGNAHPVHYVSTHPFLTDGGRWHELAQKHGSDWSEMLPHSRSYGAIEVGHDVWIGQEVRVKGGVKIGTGSVIAAGATVTKDVPPYTIVGGMPAKVIRQRFDDRTIERLLEGEWWRYAYWDLKNLSFDDPVRFAEEFLGIKENLTPFEPRVFSVSDILSA
jgi:virginiamycin A acetyltransferase